MKRWLHAAGRRSVGSQIRLFVGVLALLVPLGVFISLATIQSQTEAVRSLTLALGPALETNSTVRLTMTRAESAWAQTLAGDVVTPSYADLRPDVVAGLDLTTAFATREELAEADRTTYRSLVERERTAVSGWFDAAAATVEAQRVQPSAVPLRREAARRAFATFTAASDDLTERIRSQRNAARVQSRAAAGVTTNVISGVGVLVVVVLLLAGFAANRSIAGPLARLGGVVRRQSENDEIVMANQEEGALEVRHLARDFNGLTRANSRLVDQQAAVLRVQELVLEVARGARRAVDVTEALQLVCATLGAGLEADRALLYTLGDDGHTIEERLQWTRADLPELPPLPRSLAAQVGEVNEQLRRDVGFFDLRDLLDTETYQDERVRAFHRATGARSLLMVPIGTGGRGLGILTLMMVASPRRWHRHEIQALQQCASIAAQAIIALRLSRMQDEQVHRLTELDRQKTDFMATISHELRTPLTSIAGYLELLDDGDFGELTDGQRTALGIIGRNATRLRGLIEDLLVLNKIEASGLAAVAEDVPVSELLRSVTETMEPLAAANGVRLVSLPVAEDLMLHVDRSQLERALINLGSNAVKFTPHGGEVTLAAERSGDYTVVTVSDTGIGIPAADQARLSERFFRAGNATANAIPGTGLGLAIVRAIVEGHGGELIISSIEGEGTTMQVVLPVVRALTAAPTAQAAVSGAAHEA